MTVPHTWMIVLGECAACGRLFGFSPSRVPSVRIGGEREPVCRDCMGMLNARRVEAGMRPWRIHPEAYAPDPVGDGGPEDLEPRRYLDG
jgi:hypothetical protein